VISSSLGLIVLRFQAIVVVFYDLNRSPFLCDRLNRLNRLPVCVSSTGSSLKH